MKWHTAETYLPEDIVFRILARLPVKSLIRFAVVCRLWCRVILYDRDFATAQLEAARQNQSQSHRRLLVSGHLEDDSPSIHSMDLSFSGVRQMEIEPADTLLLLGSCNGLVFLTPPPYKYKSGCGGEWFCVWNPSTSYRTRKQIQFPEPSFDMNNVAVEWNVYFGVGYVSATHDYKLLLAHYLFDFEDEFIKADVNLFSSRSNSWKNITSPNQIDNVRCYRTPATVVRERLHWISKFSDYAILCFDLESEEFQTMALPGNNGNSCLGVSAQGCLTVGRFPVQGDKNGDKFLVDLWVMTQYGVPQSWTKLYRFIYSGLQRSVNFLVMETCTVATLPVQKNRFNLMLINHKDKVEHHSGLYQIRTLDSVFYCILDYEESLLKFDYI